MKKRFLIYREGKELQAAAVSGFTAAYRYAVILLSKEVETPVIVEDTRPIPGGSKKVRVKLNVEVLEKEGDQP